MNIVPCRYIHSRYVECGAIEVEIVERFNGPSYPEDKLL
jgi:hypothetical protein